MGISNEKQKNKIYKVVIINSQWISFQKNSQWSGKKNPTKRKFPKK